MDESVPELHESLPSSIHEPHSVCSHFPKDRNCEICHRTKITRAPCITADHEILSEGCESRNNHRCAVVVQDLATQWIPSYLCKIKKKFNRVRVKQNSQEIDKSSRKFLEPTGKPQVIYTDNSLEFGQACEDLLWNHCTSTSHRSETNGIAERAVRRIKEGTSAVLLQSGLDEKW